MAHPEIGRRILERLIEELADVAVPESMPRMEGKTMDTILTGRPGQQAAGAEAGAAASAAAGLVRSVAFNTREERCRN